VPAANDARRHVANDERAPRREGHRVEVEWDETTTLVDLLPNWNQPPLPAEEFGGAADGFSVCVVVIAHVSERPCACLISRQCAHEAPDGDKVCKSADIHRTIGSLRRKLHLADGPGKNDPS
jgi:hypothetical protein